MRRSLIPAALLVVVTSCGTLERIGGSFAATVGAADDYFCDRREVRPDKRDQRASFCQDITGTVAGDEFRKDCDEKFGARNGVSQCGHEGSLGGCAVAEVERDGSQVTDWFYPVDFDEKAPKTRQEVEALCADKARYERGARYVAP